MTNYQILSAPAAGRWIVTATGQTKLVFTGDITTLRSDYVAALGATVTPVGGGDETDLTVLAQANLDLDDDANWTDAVEDGFQFINDGDIEVSAYYDGTGGGTRQVTIEGNPGSDLVLTLNPGQVKNSGRLSLSRFSSFVLVHFDDHTGVYVMAVRKGSV